MAVIDPFDVHAPLILALDIGTSSTRALLFDAQARAVRGIEAWRKTDIRTTQEGASEIDANQLLNCLWECVDELLDRSGALAPLIGGVASCTFVGNLVGLDEGGCAITPLMTYADTRAAAEAAELKTRLDERIIHDRTGAHFHPSYLPARFFWMERARPEWLVDVKHWVSIGELLAHQLFGELAVSFSVASWTGLLDRLRLTWDDELLAALPVHPENFSHLIDIDQPWQGLRPEFAHRWPTLRDVPWFPTLGDGAAANIGSGCVSGERVAVTVGTSSAVRVAMTEAISQVPEGLWCYRVDRKRSLLGGALGEGGNIFAWLKQTLKLNTIPDLERALAAVPADSHGLTFLPLLAGERSPGWQGHLRGAIAGLSLATTPVELAKAGLEGLAYRIAEIYRLLRPTLPAEPQVIASGGALLHSSILLQTIADAVGRPVTRWGAGEATARGCALLALQSLGILRGLSDTPDLSYANYLPDPERHQSYSLAMQRQTRLYELIKGF